MAVLPFVWPRCWFLSSIPWLAVFVILPPKPQKVPAATFSPKTAPNVAKTTKTAGCRIMLAREAQCCVVLPPTLYATIATPTLYDSGLCEVTLYDLPLYANIGIRRLRKDAVSGDSRWTNCTTLSPAIRTQKFNRGYVKILLTISGVYGIMGSEHTKKGGIK